MARSSEIRAGGGGSMGVFGFILCMVCVAGVVFAQSGEGKAAGSSGAAGAAGMIADDDPEWVKVADELKKLPPAKIKAAWIANEKQMAERAIAEQKAREDLWKQAAEARQSDAKCLAIRAEIERLRKQLEEAALQSPAASAADAKTKEAHRAFLLAVKKRQHLGRMMRELPADQVESITKEADVAVGGVVRPAVPPGTTDTNKTRAAGGAVKP